MKSVAEKSGEDAGERSCGNAIVGAEVSIADFSFTLNGLKLRRGETLVKTD